MDMVGGGPGTGAVFHVTRSPASLPTFVNDVAEAFGDYVNEQSLAHASGESVQYPLVAPEGGKGAMFAEISEFTGGSDHEVYTDSAFRIPRIPNDWPDRYIDTDHDLPANIDPTKLKRAGFIGAASAWYFANLDESGIPGLLSLLERQQLERTAVLLRRRVGAPADESDALTRFHWAYERGVIDSINRFVPLASEQAATVEGRLQTLDSAYQRRRSGTRSGGGRACLSAQSRSERANGRLRLRLLRRPSRRGAGEALELLRYQGLRGDGADYALEALNFVDGVRTVQAIRDALSAEFGPVPVGLVASYLHALEEIGVLQRN